ncbi:MAG: serine hydrolase, partial [Gemmatimonadetes bacterium]|nr:serine hydrolase [Gemmatimonadota bacterium]
MQQRRVAVEVEVVGVVVVLPGRGNGGIGQLGPATADARDAFPVEVGHDLGAEEAPLRDVVPRDQEREGHRRSRDNCPRSRAPPRGEEDPGAGDGSREEGEPEAAVQSHGPEPRGCLPVEAVGAVPVHGNGVRDWRRDVTVSRFHPMKVKQLISGTVLAALAAACTPPDQPGGLPAAVDAVFADYSATDGPGCAVGVIQDGRLIGSGGYGMANLDHGIPNGPATVFRSGSVSKQFTAGAIALLALRGDLDLDAPVRRYLPD